jgi:hypothetical protein
LHAGRPHAFECPPPISRFQIDRAAAVLDDKRLKAETDGVQRRRLHAIISRQAEQVNRLDAD